MKKENIYNKLKELNRLKDDIKIHKYFMDLRKDMASEYVIIYDNIKLIDIFKGGKKIKSYFIVGFNRSHKNKLDKYDKRKLFVIDSNSYKNIELLKKGILNPKGKYYKYLNFKLKEK